jgi:hypothetical protein
MLKQRVTAVTLAVAVLLAPLLPVTAHAQDDGIYWSQDQQVATTRENLAQLQRQRWYAQLDSRRIDDRMDRCAWRIHKLRDTLADCREELDVCTDPCARIDCQPWQECRIYEPMGEPFCADTCDGFECPPGTHCELIDVACIRAPCPPMADCIPDDICQLPSDVGPCEAIVPRWFHNAETGECERFIWGGCGGNANNFETREACERTCPPPDRCELPADTGPCKALIPRWFHNPVTDECEMFTYGGCDGNANNFETYEDCIQACPRSDRCELPPETGACLAAFLRWYFDPATGTCERFTWGGCGGNENRFETVDNCLHACGLTPGDLQ